MAYIFSHPRIFSDLLVIYKKYYSAHKNLPKIFRVTIGEYIMSELALCMKTVVMANLKRSKDDYKKSCKLLKGLRARIEILKSYFLIAWDMKFISHQFFADINERLEEVSKEAAKWHDWFERSLICPKDSGGQPKAS
ncbi:MAG: four helix bundle protein [Candidatus Paceibacterota bacterium]